MKPTPPIHALLQLLAQQAVREHLTAVRQPNQQDAPARSNHPLPNKSANR